MALRTWVKPTLPKATVEDPNDPVLGWSAQTTAGPTHVQAYAPWQAGFQYLQAPNLVAPAAPTTAQSGTGGTLGAGTYVYACAFGTEEGAAIPSANSTGIVVASGTTNSITVTVPAKPAWADRVYVYGRVAGALTLLGTTATTTFADTGAAGTTAEPVSYSTALVNH